MGTKNEGTLNTFRFVEVFKKTNMSYLRHCGHECFPSLCLLLSYQMLWIRQIQVAELLSSAGMQLLMRQLGHPGIHSSSRSGWCLCLCVGKCTCAW